MSENRNPDFFQKLALKENTHNDYLIITKEQLTVRLEGYRNEKLRIIESIIDFKRDLFCFLKENSSNIKAKEVYKKMSAAEKRILDEDIKDSGLDKNKNTELKILYKNAAKLCHPDMSVSADKEKAKIEFQKLNEAYLKKDIESIRRIYHKLKNKINISPKDIGYNQVELIIKLLKKKIKQVKSEIKELRNSYFYKLSRDKNRSRLFKEILK